MVGLTIGSFADVASAMKAIATCLIPHQDDAEKIVDVVQKAASSRHAEGDEWRNHVLWVDNRPSNNIYEWQIFEAFGLRFTLAISTADEALGKLSKQRFAAVIADMERY